MLNGATLLQLNHDPWRHLSATQVGSQKMTDEREMSLRSEARATLYFTAITHGGAIVNRAAHRMTDSIWDSTLMGHARIHADPSTRVTNNNSEPTLAALRPTSRDQAELRPS